MTRSRGRGSAFACEITPLLAASGVRGDWISWQRQQVTSGSSTDPAEWARRIFSDPPRWVGAALALRDRLVGLVGIRPSSRETFAVLARSGDEVIVGTDDRHIDFRASVRCSDGFVDVTTIVQVHNRLGWFYLLPVRLVHASMVRSMLARAARLERAA
ncbi:DUF2867 domain-containing protein [Microbacterium sp.]|uniref:DUF2867 domain-containing protein n=1 Tax=Microbacterium sp. TaxID=51671 RepID=UPI002811C25F|nr:DUF2867 domain-containing protein [Microbacterium sp.]